MEAARVRQCIIAENCHHQRNFVESVEPVHDRQRYERAVCVDQLEKSPNRNNTVACIPLQKASHDVNAGSELNVLFHVGEDEGTLAKGKEALHFIVISHEPQVLFEFGLPTV